MLNRASAATLSAMVLTLTACGPQSASDGETTNDTSARTTTMEGGGVYPSPSPSLAVEPMATDPAASATHNEQKNLAPPVK